MPKLVVENGPDRGHTFLVEPGRVLAVGRDASAEITLRDEMASRRHFEIEGRNDSFFIRDLSSSNGTHLNGEPVKGARLLAPHDRIQCGETVLTFVGDEPHPLLGKEISGYKILDRIGRGGMGTVYRALQTSLDRIVALKILAPHLVKNSNFINLFIREARAAGALSHPHIVQVYDVGVHEDIYYFSMEFIPGGSVEDILNRERSISLARALRITRDAARGLQYAENKGIIHRDIKPGNLMVGTGEVIKIGDLGIARSTGGEGSISQKDGVSGSPHYIAPEQARGQDIDHRVDIYSLGVSLYHMIAGRTPYSGRTPREVILKHLKEDPPGLESLVPQLPPEVGALVVDMMAKDKEQRIASAGALLERLEPILARHGTESEPSRSRFPWRALTFGAVALLFLALAAWGTARFVRERNTRLEAQEQRRRDLEGRLATLGAELAAGRLDGVTEALTDPRLQELLEEDGDPDLLAEFQGLRSDLQTARDEREQQARREEARRALAELLAEAPSVATADSIAALREFARQHSGTPAADEAIEKADRDQAELTRRQSFEAEATRDVERLLADARRRLDQGRHLDALGSLEGLDPRFAESEAAGALEEMATRIRGAASQEWRKEKQRIEKLATDGSYAEAEHRLKLFRDRSGTPRLEEELESMESTLATLREQPRAPRGVTQEVSNEHAWQGIANAWRSFSRELDASSATTYLGTFELPGPITDESRRQLETHARYLERLEVQLRRLLSRQAPTPAAPVELASERESRKRVRVTEVRLAQGSYRVVYEPGEGRPPTFARWEELTQASRARVLLAWARTPAERFHAGVFAAFNGEVERGNEAIRKALADGAEELRENWTDIAALLALRPRE